MCLSSVATVMRTRGMGESAQLSCMKTVPTGWVVKSFLPSSELMEAAGAASMLALMSSTVSRPGGLMSTGLVRSKD